MTDIGFYIHIPFCIKKCNYCNFYSISQHKLLPNIINQYVQALLSEIDIFFNTSKITLLINTIYFGGGTPNILSIKNISEILDRIKPSLSSEITIELNPTASKKNKNYFKQLFDLGINRISLGIQSFNDNELKLLGRIHTAKEAIESYNQLRDIGFKNISIDLINSIPNQSIKDYEKTLKKAISLNPEHISSYTLKIEPNTNFFKKYNSNEDKEAEFMLKTMQYLKADGYIHYEVSNYAKNKNYMSKHNLKYWERKEYIGFGPSSHSFFKNERWANVSDIITYIKMLNMKKIPIEFKEKITENEKTIETLFLELRTNKGINIDLIDKDKLKILLNENLCFLSKDKVIFTEQGFLKADKIVEFLL